MAGYVWLGIFAFGFVIPGGHSQWSVDDNGCRTPDRGVGNCKPIMECQPMIDVLKTIKRPISPEIQVKIKAYTCGSSNGEHKVCCPSGPINLNIASSELFHQRSQPPDVTNHINIKMLPETCGILDTSTRIVNGNDSALNEFPWMALLQYKRHSDNLLRFRCGGTIINKRYILTAAHCVANLDGQSLVNVRVGEYSIQNNTDCEKQANKKIICNPPVQDLSIEVAIPHPQYGGEAGGYVNDIALIRVAPINLEVESARPVCMPVGLVRDWKYKRVIVTGWGVTDAYTRQTADILQKVGLAVADKAKCVKTYKESKIPITNTQTCVGEGVKDSCGGDSGGPMLVLTPVGEDFNIIYVQQGIVSFGPRICANPDYPGIYTLVKFYMDWILDNMKE